MRQNVAGCFRLDEPGSDLAMVCALVSSLRAQAVDKDTVLIGEIGLTGELRSPYLSCRGMQKVASGRFPTGR